jgi:hypothetical protein
MLMHLLCSFIKADFYLMNKHHFGQNFGIIRPEVNSFLVLQIQKLFQI